MFAVPTPTVIVFAPANQTVGQLAILECTVFSVRGITSRVDIVWSSNGTVLKRTDNVSFVVDNTTYLDSYTISQLSTTDEGRVIQCQVVINASSPVMANGTNTLNVTGECTYSTSQKCANMRSTYFTHIIEYQSNTVQ